MTCVVQVESRDTVDLLGLTTLAPDSIVTMYACALQQQCDM